MHSTWSAARRIFSTRSARQAQIEGQTKCTVLMPAARRSASRPRLKSGASMPPAVFVGIDAPDFNLGLEADLRAAGIKTVHFVCPSIWAWRADRVEKIRRAADHVLCIFPFEPELLARHGIDATYVGHPLASVIPLQPDRAARSEERR